MEYLRESKGYKKSLSHADMLQQGQFDGKGHLSSKALQKYVNFMLDVALDQVNYMSKYLKLHVFSSRMD